MKLNALEFLVVNNPMRAYVQEHYGLSILLKMMPPIKCETVLEIGCGNGTGAKLAKKYLNPGRVCGIDLDERMIRTAVSRTRNTGIPFGVMDSTALGFPKETFNLVLDFGIIHHIPNWKDCIAEIYRVLKPGGALVMEDLSIETFSGFPGKLWKRLLAHPYAEMYSVEEFISCLDRVGLTVIDLKVSNPFKMIKFFSLVAVKADSNLSSV